MGGATEASITTRATDRLSNQRFELGTGQSLCFHPPATPNRQWRCSGQCQVSSSGTSIHVGLSRWLTLIPPMKNSYPYFASQRRGVHPITNWPSAATTAVRRSRHALGLIVLAQLQHFLLSEHRAPFIGALPYCCFHAPLIAHVFMHHGRIGGITARRKPNRATGCLPPAHRQNRTVNGRTPAYGPGCAPSSSAQPYPHVCVHSFQLVLQPTA